MTATATYNASSITVLEGLDPVRKRPGMYIGGTGSAGLHHLVWEIFDNSVDEAMNGHADQIEVTLHKDGAGASVVNALSKKLVATVRRDGAEWQMEFSQGKATGKLKKLGPARGSGTTTFFHPDPA